MLYIAFLTVTPIVLILSIGSLLGKTIQGLIIIFPFMFIRKFSGGIHAKKLRTCLLSSCVVLFLVVWLVDKLNNNIFLSISVFSAAFSLICFSPIDSENRRLSVDERKEYKITTISMTIIFVAIYGVLLYTPEYRAKLDERARKRAEAKRAKQVEEFNNNRLAIAEKYGFNPEGKIYVVTGNTYEIREELMEAGAKYRGGINWYFLEKQDRYPTIEISYEECLNIYPEYGTMSWKDFTEVQEVLNSKIPTEEDPSQYVGQVGERLDLVVTFKKRSTYEIPSYAGWGTDTVGINVFRDDAGNCFIWKSTSAFFNIAEGSQVRLRGTVKEHSDYKGTKQTILQRCRVEAVK